MKRQLLHDLHLAVGGQAAREVIRRHVDGMTDVPPDRSRAPADRRDEIDDAIVMLRYDIAGPALTRGVADCAYELLRARAQVVLGDIDDLAAETGLTRSECVAWADSQESRPAVWLLRSAGLDGITDIVSVARWAIRMSASVKRREAIHQRRTIGGIEGSVIGRLDELRPCDLSGSVIDTLEAAHRRVLAETWGDDDELAEEAPWERHLPQNVARLRTFSELHAEGAAMRNCVGTDLSYARGVQAREWDIFSIRDGMDSATLLVRDRRVDQCYGPRNSQPSEDVLALARRVAAIRDGGGRGAE